MGVGNTQDDRLLIGRDDRGIFLSARGSIRAPRCYPLRESLLPLIEELGSGQTIFVDLSSCIYMDSTFIGLLVSMDRKVKKASGERLRVIDPSTPCRAALQDIGLGDFFSVGEEKTALPPRMTEVVEQGDKPTARFVLDAHEALMETSAEARKRFGALMNVLQRALKPEKPPRDTP
jgi:anti-anti-sigma factor